MASLLDLARESSGDNSGALRELRISGEPAAVLIFTDDSEPCRMHWESDPLFRSYVVCPGEGCPLCFLGNAPQDFALLPVLNVESGEVEVVRISRRRGPGQLLDGLLPVLARQDLADQLILIQKHPTNHRYTVTCQALPPSASRHERAIAQFIEQREAGLSLSTAFCAPSVTELLEAPRIRAKIEHIGGYQPPQPRA
jgi:hypothetical protein